MKITKKLMVEQEIEVCEDIICNRCSKSCRDDGGIAMNDQDFYGLIEASVSGGFSSPRLNDLTTYTFSICEACLSELFSTFKVPVKTHSIA